MEIREHLMWPQQMYFFKVIIDASSGIEFYSRQNFQFGKNYLSIIKTKFMKKKILFGAMFGIMTLMTMSFAKKLQAIWTSTCGIKHYTTFAEGTSQSLMAWYIAEINAAECGGVKPTVSFN